jgi:TRAP-type C4-dicarboxylate transport system permease small subunit
MSPLSGTSARTGLLRTAVQVLAAIGSLAVAAMIVVTVADVVGRRVGMPVKGAYDVVRVLGAVAMAGALPLTKAVKGHIAIEYFFQKLGRRGRAGMDTAMRLCLLGLFGILAWQFARQGATFRSSGEVTATLRMPMFWVPWLMSAACVATAGVTLWHLLHPGRSMMRPKA